MPSCTRRGDDLKEDVAASGQEPGDPYGDSTHPHSISQIVERIVRRAGILRIPLHHLRRNRGTVLIKAGVPAMVASERPGRTRSDRGLLVAGQDSNPRHRAHGE